MEAKSYRPLTLLSVVGKTFESIIAERINFMLLLNKVLDDAQEGFRKGRGTFQMLYKLFAIDNKKKLPSTESNSNRDRP